MDAVEKSAFSLGIRQSFENPVPCSQPKSIWKLKREVRVCILVARHCAAHLALHVRTPLATELGRIHVVVPVIR